jgi:N-acyl-D-amino-acid deacylase
MRRVLFVAGACLVGTAVVLGLQSQSRGTSSPPFDLLIRNGRVLDGSGNPWVRADVGVRDGRIAAVGNLSRGRATRTIDAAGRLVTPGFIDVHSHAAEGLGRTGLQQGRPLLAQGVTTILGNPDGGGPVDIAAQRDRLARLGLGVNVALLVGHGSVRGAVLGTAANPPTPSQLEDMRALVRHAMPIFDSLGPEKRRHTQDYQCCRALDSICG